MLTKEQAFARFKELINTPEKLAQLRHQQLREMADAEADGNAVEALYDIYDGGVEPYPKDEQGIFNEIFGMFAQYDSVDEEEWEENLTLENEDRESQSSKHCDPGYMNDTRFGNDENE